MKFAAKKFSSMGLWFNRFSIFISSLCPQRKFSKCDVLFISPDSSRFALTQYGFSSPVLDAIKRELCNEGYTTEHIARPYSHKFGKDCAHGSIQINLSFVFARILDCLLEFFFSYSWFEKKIYEVIISKVGCKLIIGIELPQMLCSAARTKRLQTIEILHGRGIETLQPYILNRERSLLPELFMGFDHVSINTYAKHGIDIKLVKYPYEPNVKYVASKGDRNFVLVTLQWGYCGDYQGFDGRVVNLSNGLFVDDLVSAIEATAHIWNWRFRLHPVIESSSGYTKLLNQFKEWTSCLPNVSIHSSRAGVIESSVENCFAHITMNSGAVYEAASMGVPSLVLCSTVKQNGPRANRFADLEYSGYLYKTASTASEIISWLNQMNGIKLSPFAYDAPHIADTVISILEGQPNNALM